MEETKPRIAKQVLVMRKDLNCRKGKLIAQGSHASLKVILDMMVANELDGHRLLKIYPGTALQDWINGKFTKICVSVDSLDELADVYAKAKLSGLPCSLITDAGLTEFNGIPTVTCCSVGPAWSDEIDPITGHLKLL